MQCVIHMHRLPVWLIGNALCLDHTLRQTLLVPGWVTVLGRVNHLSAEPRTQVYWAWAIPYG